MSRQILVFMQSESSFKLTKHNFDLARATAFLETSISLVDSNKAWLPNFSYSKIEHSQVPACFNYYMWWWIYFPGQQRKSVPVACEGVRCVWLIGTVPAKYALFTCTAPVRYTLFTGRAPVNNLFHNNNENINKKTWSSVSNSSFSWAFIDEFS